MEHKVRNHIVKGATTVLVAASILTGMAFSGPAEIIDDQSAVNYNQAPIVMELDEFVNAPVDDDGDEADEQKGARPGIVARFKQAVLSLPQSIRLLIVVPLWAAGTAFLTAISFLWNIIFASPLSAFIASLAFGFAILVGLFTATAKMLFPDIPVRKLLSKRNLIALGATAVILSCIDAVAPMYWHQYPLAASLVKIALGGTVIGLLSARIKRLFNDSLLSGHIS